MPKKGPVSLGHIFYIGLYGGGAHDEKIFLSETTRPRALIFDMMQNFQVDLNQVCSSYATWLQKWPLPGVTRLIKGKLDKTLLV